MPRELKRGMIRIGMNYFRLLTSVVLGLFLVRILLESIGMHGFGLVSLFGSTVGIAAMFKEIIRACMIRELGSAYHSGDDGLFRATFNSAMLVTLALATITLCIFAGLWACVDLDVFEVHEMYAAAHGLLAARGIEVFATIALAPIFNMYLVSERMVAHNLWVLVEQRIAQFAAAAWVTFVSRNPDPSAALIEFAWLSAILTVAGLVVACAVIALKDRRLIPAPRLIRREAIRAVLSIGGWNAATVTAMNLHIRSNAIIMNIAFGLVANSVFGLAVQLTSYTRRLAVGMTDGLDAVSARITSGGDGENRLHRLVHHATRLNGLVTIPSTVAVIVLADPLLRIWVGDKVDHPAKIPPAVVMVQIISLGIAARAVADGWTRIMYGAGHIRRYALLILAAGVLNPILSVFLIWTIRGEALEWNGPAWAFTLSMVGVQAAGIPIIMSRVLNMRYTSIVGPLLKPLIVSVVCAPVYLLFPRDGTLWSIWTLLSALGAYGVVYAAGTWLFTLTAQERSDILDVIRRRSLRPRREGGRAGSYDQPDEPAAS